jgi:NAD(P)-dependent dehydrogenase (short-subunit alcohol dehydrogenase family)
MAASRRWQVGKRNRAGVKGSVQKMVSPFFEQPHHDWRKEWIMDFSGKHVLITGGSRGIGKACAQAFAKRGAQVTINYRSNIAAAQETLNGLSGDGHMLVQADVAQPDSVQQMFEDVIREYGKLDIVVNNAGISQRHPIDAVDYGTWQHAWGQILAVNLIGPANVMYWAVHHMKSGRGGRIVNVSSRGAFRGEPLQPAYGASKAGLNSMSQSLAQQVAKYNIYIGVVAPGFVETDMAAERLSGPGGDQIRQQSPLGRVARPEEVAYAVLFLASDGSEFSTGAIIDVNGASYLRS